MLTYINDIKATIIKRIINNPNSSDTTDKIKSESLIGRNLRYDWVPSPSPLPKKPPDPIATLD